MVILQVDKVFTSKLQKMVLRDNDQTTKQKQKSQLKRKSYLCTAGLALGAEVLDLSGLSVWFSGGGVGKRPGAGDEGAGGEIDGLTAATGLPDLSVRKTGSGVDLFKSIFPTQHVQVTEARTR